MTTTDANPTPMAAPVTDITTVVPPHASSRWLLIHARLDAGVVRIRSARPAVSSVRRRNTAETV